MVSFINSQHISTLHNLFFLFLFLLMIRSESVWYLVNWMWRTLGPTHHRPQSPTNTHISLDINVTKDLYSSYIKFSYFISETSRNVHSGKKEEQMCKCLMTMCFLRKLNILCSKSQILIFLYNSMSESWPQNVARGWRRGSVMLVLISNINYLWLITRIHNQSSQRHMLVPSLSAVSFTKKSNREKETANYYCKMSTKMMNYLLEDFSHISILKWLHSHAAWLEKGWNEMFSIWLQ